MNFRAATCPCLFLVVAGCTHVTQSQTQIAPPTSAVHSTMRRQVTNAVYAGEGNPVLRQLRERVAAEPTVLSHRLALAAAYKEAGFPELSIDHYRIALQQNPGSEEILLLEIQALKQLGLTQQAIDAIRAFENSRQPSARLVSELAVMLDNAGQHSEAELAHRRALNLAPRDDRYHNNLGYCLLLQERYQEAEAEFHKALAIAPWSRVARNNLGLALAKNPEGPRSQDALTNWSTIASPAAAHNNLAAVHIEKGEFEQARQELAIALSYEKEHLPALRNLQLVSELDGKPASVQINPQVSSWRRFMTGLKKALVEKEELPANKPETVATR